MALILHSSGTRFSWAAIWSHTTKSMLPIVMVGKKSADRSGCAGSDPYATDLPTAET
jgi:hypothetical protein